MPRRRRRPQQRQGRGYYQSLAAQIAAEEGVPVPLFMGMIEAESGWNPAAGSSAGAIGLGQLMPGTAAGLGVNPHNPTQNLQGAARYLASMLKRFGSPQLALSAYNSGPAGAEAGGSVEGYSETQAYVKRVMELQKAYGKFDTGGNVGNMPIGDNSSKKGGQQGQTAVASFLDAPPDIGARANLGPLTARAVAATQKNQQLSMLSGQPITAKQARNAPGNTPDGRTPLMIDYGAPLGGKWTAGGGSAAHGSRPMHNWQSDNAVDLMTPRGTPVYSLFSGVINDRIGSLDSSNPLLAGLRLTVNGKANSAYYAHL